MLQEKYKKMGSKYKATVAKLNAITKKYQESASNLYYSNAVKRYAKLISKWKAHTKSKGNEKSLRKPTGEAVGNDNFLKRKISQKDIQIGKKPEFTYKPSIDELSNIIMKSIGLTP